MVGPRRPMMRLVQMEGGESEKLRYLTALVLLTIRRPTHGPASDALWDCELLSMCIADPQSAPCATLFLHKPLRSHARRLDLCLAPRQRDLRKHPHQ